MGVVLFSRLRTSSPNVRPSSTKRIIPRARPRGFPTRNPGLFRVSRVGAASDAGRCYSGAQCANSRGEIVRGRETVKFPGDDPGLFRTPRRVARNAGLGAGIPTMGNGMGRVYPQEPAPIPLYRNPKNKKLWNRPWVASPGQFPPDFSPSRLKWIFAGVLPPRPFRVFGQEIVAGGPRTMSVLGATHKSFGETSSKTRGGDAKVSEKLVRKLVSFFADAYFGNAQRFRRITVPPVSP